MTGRHAAPPDENFDQQARQSAGAHRADVDPSPVAAPTSVAADPPPPTGKPATQSPS